MYRKYRKPALSLSLMLLALLTACASVPTPPVSTPLTPTTDYFTDAIALSFIPRLAEIGATRPDTNLAALISAKIGVDVLRLHRLTGNIGDCVSVDYYDLSPSYELVVDTNACYEGGVSIVKKGSDGASGLVTASPN